MVILHPRKAKTVDNEPSAVRRARVSFSQVSSTNSKGITRLMFFLRLRRTSSGRLHVSNYTQVHYDPASDIMVMHVNSAPKTYVRVTQKQYNMDMLDLLKVAAAET
jgi:hypothetical protein